MAAKRNSRGISQEPASPKRQRRGASMRVPGKGTIAAPVGRDYHGRVSALHADVMLGKKAKPHKYENVLGREHVTF